MEQFLAVAENAAKQAGQILLHHLGKVTAKEKRLRDLVTQADFDSQDKIKSLLLNAFPEHGFLGEEGNHTNVSAEYVWIVDPLDGTTNFVHQLPGFAVSIALRKTDKSPSDMVVGVIFDPITNECFSAIKGQGASLNGQSIRTSSCIDIERSLLVCSFPSRVERDSIEVNRFLNLLTKSTVRRMGSAALNLSNVACGRIDGYWASSLSLWDMAAGYVIAREAGATFTHMDGGPVQFDDPQFVMAATKQLHQAILAEM